jgi:hypothetical protein
MPLILPEHMAYLARPKSPPVTIGVFLTLDWLPIGQPSFPLPLSYNAGRRARG